MSQPKNADAKKPAAGASGRSNAWRMYVRRALGVTILAAAICGGLYAACAWLRTTCCGTIRIGCRSIR